MRVSLVLQDPEAQIIGMSVEDDLAFGPENYGIPATEIRSRMAESLSLVGLSGLESLDTYALSGGQKQRLAIAAALMVKPEVLILDEPTSELDPEGKEQVFAIIDRLRSDGGSTIIIVEHDISRLARMADKLLVLDHGTVAAHGRPADLLMDIELFERTGGERPPAAAEIAWRLHRAHLVRSAAYGLDLDVALTAIEQELREVGVDL
jgi:energy-coupling factor transporter ATP-binding protein EcfA2